MANPHYRTYQFKEKHLGTGDILRLKIIYKINSEGEDVLITAEDEEIYLSDPGYKEEEFDLENLMLAVTFYSPVLSVPENSEFEKYLFNDDDEPYRSAEKNFQLILDIKYEGAGDFENEISANVIEDSIDYNPETTELRFEAAPDTDILNRTMLFGLNDIAGRPGEKVRLNPLGYTDPINYSTDPISYPAEYYVNLKKIITDIYKKVNDSITENDLIFYHNWLMAGYYVDDEGDKQFDFEIALEEARLSTTQLFFKPDYGLINLGDVLRKLAIDFGCFTGMLGNKKPFFKKLFSKNTLDVYELDEDSYIDRRKSYRLPLIKYVRILSRWVSTTLGYSYEWAFHAPNEDAYTGLENTYIDRDSLVASHTMPNGFTGPPLWGGLIRATNVLVLRANPTRIYYIFAFKDGAIEYTQSSPDWYNFDDLSYVPAGKVLADFWYKNRARITNSRIDPIIAVGLNHSIIRNPKFKGKIYQPVRTRKMYKQGITEIDGMIVS